MHLNLGHQRLPFHTYIYLYFSALVGGEGEGGDANLLFLIVSPPPYRLALEWWWASNGVATANSLDFLFCFCERKIFAKFKYCILWDFVWKSCKTWKISCGEIKFFGHFHKNIAFVYIFCDSDPDGLTLFCFNIVLFPGPGSTWINIVFSWTQINIVFSWIRIHMDQHCSVSWIWIHKDHNCYVSWIRIHMDHHCFVSWIRIQIGVRICSGILLI